jgi:hypothetical protein
MPKHDEKHEISAADIQNPGVEHDTTDINVRAVIGTLAAMVLAAILIHAVVAAMLIYFERTSAEGEPEPNPMRVGRTTSGPTDPVKTFPQPQLQPDPVGDLNKLFVQEDQYLNTYGWVDKNAGVVHVPINDAMEMFLQQNSSSNPAPQGATKPGQVYHPRNLPSDYQESK